MKISWIGPWVSRIDWCKGHWFCSTHVAVRLANISSKTGKKCIFCVFRPFLSLCQTASRPYRFTSINPTNPRTNPWNFRQKILRIGGAGKWRFVFFVFGCWVFQKKKTKGFHLGKDFIPTNMHTTVAETSAHCRSWSCLHLIIYFLEDKIMFRRKMRVGFTKIIICTHKFVGTEARIIY